MRNKTSAIYFVFTLTFVLALVILVNTPSLTTAQNATKWEYLTINYYQFAVDAFGNTTDARYEVVATEDSMYQTQFIEFYQGVCTELTLNSTVEEKNCHAANLKGREFYLNLLGDDGWELFNIDNQSTQFNYHVELLFKRQK